MEKRGLIMEKKIRVTTDLEPRDIILIDLSPTRGHEQSGERPAVVISITKFMRNSKFAVIVPITSTDPSTKSSISHLAEYYIPLDGTTKATGFLIPNHVRSVDLDGRGFKYLFDKTGKTKEKLPKELYKQVIDCLSKRIIAMPGNESFRTYTGGILRVHDAIICQPLSDDDWW
jgi:mRNA-degrading endonuclease toxin of MazEF toxin-antitoxin module